MGGGGKGGSTSQTTTTQMPAFMRPYVERNLQRAETAQKIGYQPYYGPDIAAFNPTQMAAFGSNIGAAEAFGLIPRGSVSPMQGMAPEPQTFAGGVQGYSSAPLFEQALAEFEAKRPGQAAQYNKLFVDPYDPNKTPPTPAGPPAPVIGEIAPSPASWTHNRTGTHLAGGFVPYGWTQIPGTEFVIRNFDDSQGSGTTDKYDSTTGSWYK